jgi:hypothetical protein
MLFFTPLVILCASFVIRELLRGRVRRFRILAVWLILGTASGAALAGKHTSALVIIPAYLAVFIQILYAPGEGSPEEMRKTRIRLVFQWLGSGLLGLSVFYILTPVWWCFPLHWLLLLCISAACFAFGLPGRGWRAWIFRSIPIVAAAWISLAAPEAWAATYQPILHIARARAQLTEVHETLGLELASGSSRFGEMEAQLLYAKTQYYECLEWDDLEQEQAQIRDYEDVLLDGRGGGTAWGTVGLALAAGGFWTVFRRRRPGEAVLLLVWFAVPAVILLAVNTLAWQRYYIILIAPWSVLAGFAALPLASLDVPGRIRRFRGRFFPGSGNAE